MQLRGAPHTLAPAATMIAPLLAPACTPTHLTARVTGTAKECTSERPAFHPGRQRACQARVYPELHAPCLVTGYTPAVTPQGPAMAPPAAAPSSVAATVVASTPPSPNPKSPSAGTHCPPPEPSDLPAAAGAAPGRGAAPPPLPGSHLPGDQSGGPCCSAASAAWSSLLPSATHTPGPGLSRAWRGSPLPPAASPPPRQPCSVLPAPLGALRRCTPAALPVALVRACPGACSLLSHCLDAAAVCPSSGVA